MQIIVNAQKIASQHDICAIFRQHVNWEIIAKSIKSMNKIPVVKHIILAIAE